MCNQGFRRRCATGQDIPARRTTPTAADDLITNILPWNMIPNREAAVLDSAYAPLYSPRTSRKSGEQEEVNAKEKVMLGTVREVILRNKGDLA